MGAAITPVFERIAVVRVAGQDVADNWHVYGPWIMATMKHDLEAIDAVETMRRLRGDNFICLEVSIDGDACGIAICALSFLAAGKSLEIKALAGDNFDLWIDRMWGAIRSAAKSQGCKRVYLKGRMGWLKKLRRLGFSARVVTMEHKLNG